jgi:hypothetical protein
MFWCVAKKNSEILLSLSRREGYKQGKRHGPSNYVGHRESYLLSSLPQSLETTCGTANQVEADVVWTNFADFPLIE